MKLIYADIDIDVYFRDSNGNAAAITFSNWTRVEPKPLWTDETSKFAAFHVVAKRNHWYQCEGALSAAKLIGDATLRFERIVTLGSSMGGFAAIALAPAIGATRCVAISPQFSSDRTKTPFETRWAEDIAEIAKHGLRIDRSSSITHVLFDPYHRQDASHAALIREAAGAQLWPLKFSGHPSGFALHDLNLMELFIDTALSEVDDASLFENITRQYEERSRTSATAILNNFKHGDRSYIPTSRDEPIFGNQKVIEQVLALVK
ncbi:hypothetical protein [Ensifer sp. Root558]|uniref:hypothetical protein n=1 Tax=Ensifer sp. Root558 TaxID=1736558 RepID=UPI000716123E|nr:hypothetical protein [Ensifer sp. Root558]KQZ41859.1 hypothetical protein ASD63_16820 [Ensifer sp. Root558]